MLVAMAAGGAALTDMAGCGEWDSVKARGGRASALLFELFVRSDIQLTGRAILPAGQRRCEDRKLSCLKLSAECPVIGKFERQLPEFQIRTAVCNCVAQLGAPGTRSPSGAFGEGKRRPLAGLCSGVVTAVSHKKTSASV